MHAPAMTNRIPSDIEISQAARLRPIRDVALELGLTDDELIGFGATMARVRLDASETRKRRGRIVDVTDISPTAAGRGKSTVAVGARSGTDDGCQTG